MADENTVLIDKSALIDTALKDAYYRMVQISNDVIKRAELYGIHMDALSNPTLEQIVQHINVVIIPLVDILSNYSELSPESGIRHANIRQYALHLRQLQTALSTQNLEAFEEALSKLSSEAML